MKLLLKSCVVLLISVSGVLTVTGTVINAPVRHLYADTSYSWLALGDSYTIGQSVTVPDRFPAQTGKFLRIKGIKTETPLYIARTGWTTADLQQAIKQTKLKTRYDIVTLLIGVNDQYQSLDTAGYRVRFTELLQTAISLTGKQLNHVFVLSIPDYSITPFGNGSARVSAEIDVFNRINKQVAYTYHVKYVDITPASKEAANNRLLIAGDGLHPSAKQYAIWATLLADEIIAVLK